jgi:metallo-beta-lactamase family protein
MIILSASGMAEAGRIVYHIRWAIENRKNTIMIVSWQAPDTLGRRIADREKHVKIFGDTYKVQAEVATVGGLSAHAGQDLLTEYGLVVKNKAGEQNEENNMRQVHYPSMHTSIEL